MKINKIEFKNINSLRGEDEVDFTKEPLSSSGLFAITGPTGSGKTTLLDVICLALFKRVPRINRDITKTLIAETGAIMTRNTKECFAVVEYSCAEGVFRSKWEISTARTGNLRDYHMEVQDVQSGQMVDLKKSDVPQYNESQIGLNYDQFVKSIMLAQGDFAKFLQANKSERSELLEKITGTGIYRELGKRAFEKSKELRLELDRLRERQNTFREQLLHEDKLQESQGKHRETKAELETLEKQLSQTQKQLDLLKEVAEFQKKLGKLQLQKDQLSEAQKVFEKEGGKRIAQHEALMPFSKQLTEWQNKQHEKKRLEVQVQDLSNELKTLERQLANIKEDAAKLVGQGFHENAIAESLDAFAQKIQGLMKERDELRHAFKTLFAGLKMLNRYGAGIDPNHLAQSISTYQDIKRNTQAEFEKAKKALQSEFHAKPEESISRLEERVELLKEAIPIEKRVEEQNVRIDKLSTSHQELLEKLESLPETLKELDSTKKSQEKTTENLGLKLENQKLKAELETHRHNLKDGEACPLCGALEHPYAEQQEVEETDLEKELKAAKSALQVLEKELATKLAELKHAQGERQKLETTLAEERESLNELNHDLDKRLQFFTEAERENGLPALLNKLKGQRENMQQFINLKEKREVLQEASDDIEKLQEAYTAGKQKSDEIKALYSGKNIEQDVRAIRDKLQQTIQTQKLKKEQHASLEKELSSVTKAIETTQESISPKLRDLGYENIEQARQARLSEDVYRDLLHQRNQLAQDIKLNAYELASLQQSIQEKQEHLPKVEQETLEAQLLQQTSAKKERQETFNGLDRQLKNHEENTRRVAEIQEQMERQQEKGHQWVLLNEYIGDATGKKFNDFAQDLTLSQLIALANGRLQQLSDRYLLDKAKDEEDDSLVVIDHHLGQERRSVKTLSGGETFIMSLSLALALSDLASRNVEINSLFIDEGFGTLDPETLDQTLDVLERLQSEGSKTIGIISHVEALKERITTQIRLRRNGQGFSVLEVV